MTYDSETVKIINFFDHLPLSIFLDSPRINRDDISSKLEVLQNKFEKDIRELKTLCARNETAINLLNSFNSVELICKGLVSESSLKTQTEFINYWVSNLMLCKQTIISLVYELIPEYEDYLEFKEYLRKTIVPMFQT
jgi:hypothetical protein